MEVVAYDSCQLMRKGLEKGKRGQRAHVSVEKAGSELLGPVS